MLWGSGSPNKKDKEDLAGRRVFLAHIRAVCSVCVCFHLQKSGQKALSLSLPLEKCSEVLALWKNCIEFFEKLSSMLKALHKWFPFIVMKAMTIFYI